MKNRVVITGIGAITPIGIGKENFWNALLAGKSGINQITRFDAIGRYHMGKAQNPITIISCTKLKNRR